jgi:hypothetical protein
MALNVSTEESISEDAGQAIRNAQNRRIKEAMDAGFALSQELVPQDRGTLLESGIKPERDSTGTWRWGYTASHAWPIEEGTKPYQPPIQPLLEWSERVSGDTGLGWYVATQKIPTEGIDAQPYAKPGVEKTKQYLNGNDFRDYLNDEL